MEYRSAKGCVVDTGEWLDPWTGQTIDDAGDLDVDHHVPLEHAHVSGGADWARDRKRAYANDLDNDGALNATAAGVNRAKGAKAPDEWRPPDRSRWCTYAEWWIQVKAKWELTVTAGEVDILEDMLGSCP